MKIKASKRYKKLIELSKQDRLITLEEAVKKVKNNCTTKFDESIDVSLNLNLKKKKEEITLRTVINLPHGIKKKIKIAVICEDNKIEEAKTSGKTIVINSYEVWCGTCSKQTKVLNQAEREFEDIIFLSYEQSKNKNIAQLLGIKFWTTIVIYKGDNEMARIVGQTDKKIIYSAIQRGI